MIYFIYNLLYVFYKMVASSFRFFYTNSAYGFIKI